MKGYILFGILLNVLVHVYSECVWPDFFDLSSHKDGFGTYEEEISWETETKMDTSKAEKVNWHSKSKKLITITDNTTMEISKISNNRKDTWEIYSCYKPFGGNGFLIKKSGVFKNTKEPTIGKKTSQITYRCMKLIKRSKFVVQWMFGRENSRPHRCTETFAPINPHPLIYFPVRNLADTLRVFGYHEVFKDTIPSLVSGGYEMRVYDKKGYPVQSEGCHNEYPSPRLEMECTKGEGVRITLSRSHCTSYGISETTGSKFNILASWEEKAYIFIVLLPSGNQKVNSFHCLRINKKNPTKETAVLFLDSICKLGKPEKKKDAFFQISLRQKEINGYCTDYSDQCDQQSGRMCSNIVQRSACMKTCSVCPNLSQKLNIDDKFHGDWILERQRRQEYVRIFRNTIMLPGVGAFDAYAEPENNTCIRSKSEIMKSGSTYVLGRNPGKGCAPRTLQVILRKISDSLMLMYTSGPAPLRYNKYSLSPGKWCHNNFLDVNTFSSVFGAQWSFSSPGYGSLGLGAFPLISKVNQRPTKCGISTNRNLRYAANMKIGVEFSYPGETIRCGGESRLKGNSGLRFRYNKCSHNVPAGDIHFDCLGTFKVSYDYSMTILKRTAPGYGRKNPFIREKYWCVMIPKVKYKFMLPIIVHPAGECDFPFAYAVYRGARRPAVKIKLFQSLST